MPSAGAGYARGECQSDELNVTPRGDLRPSGWLPGGSKQARVYGLHCLYTVEAEPRAPDLLTSACSFLTALGPRVDVEAEVEVGFRQGHVQGVDLITQRHHGLRVPRGAELIQMDVQLPGG